MVLVDAPGHGGSADGPTPTWSTGGRRHRPSGGPGTYIGYSMGGRIVPARRPSADPERSSGLVLVGATGGIDDPTSGAARRPADERLADRLERRSASSAFLDEWLAQPLFAGLAAGRAPIATAAWRNTAAGPGLEPAAGRHRHPGAAVGPPRPSSTMPVLVLAGERDAKFAAVGRRGWPRPSAPNADLAVVAGAGHTAHLEQPDAFLAVLPPLARRPRRLTHRPSVRRAATGQPRRRGRRREQDAEDELQPAGAAEHRDEGRALGARRAR